MDPQDIKHRSKPPETDNNTDMKTHTKRDKKMVMAKRGIRTLAIAIAIPLSLTLINIYYFGSRKGYGPVSKNSFWFPPISVMNFACVATNFLIGLSSWLVWAEGGFHKKPWAIFFYIAQMVLGLIWNPIVFSMGISWFAFVIRLAAFGALVGCYRQFKEVKPIAGDLAKSCLAWDAFLVVVNLKLVFH